MTFPLRHILLLLLTLLSVSANARERSADEMRRAAAAVLPRAARVKAADGSVDMPTLEVLHAKEHFTVLGYADCGFAVIANDDDVEAVLGYSATAAYDSIGMPDGLQWWLASVDMALSGKRSYERATPFDFQLSPFNAQNSSFNSRLSTLNIPSSVEPMLTTRWGQEQPFNLLCPKKLYSDGYMVTGCIATAMAQVMKYHNWPARGDGELVYNFAGHVYADFASTTYEWGNMLDRYKHDEYSEVEAHAVAELMLHCGVAVGMRYDDEASGSQAQYVPAAMRSHFRYHPNINYRNRMLHTDAEWMASIYSELAAGRPVLYTGQDSKMSYGHAFVFDGYDTDGLVHVNWGWDGLYDGWFDINILNSSFLGLEFTDLQSMVVGIGMPDDDISHSIEIGIQQDLDLYSTGNARVFTLDASALQIYCLNDYDLVGTLAMVMPTANGVRVLSTIESFTADDPLISFSYLIPQYETYTITIPFGLANGTYQFYLAFREEGSDEWQPLYVAQDKVGYFSLEKDGTNYNVVGVIGNYTTGVEPMHFAENQKQNAPTYNMSGLQVGDEYRGVVVKNGKKVVRQTK